MHAVAVQARLSRTCLHASAWASASSCWQRSASSRRAAASMSRCAWPAATASARSASSACTQGWDECKCVNQRLLSLYLI
jgi:hypothetical protein